MDRSVLLSLLSLDAYNRGPNAGIGLSGTTVAGANIVDHSGTGGGYTPGSSDFYAVTYEIDDNANDLVISYRGTDDLFNVDSEGNITGDVPSAWGQGLGLWTDQSSDAVLYYQHTATSAGLGYFGSDIETTGHSLGGGLAGLVSSLYNLSAVVFNNEPYQLTAHNAYLAALDVGTPAETPADVALAQMIYGTASPVAPSTTNPITISDEDDILRLFRLTQSSGETDVPIGTNSLGFADGHSAALVTVLTFADSENNTGWLDASQPLWDAFASSDVASHVTGLSAIIGTGNDTPVEAMMTTIAYSVVDPTLSTFDKPFGDTAVRAMFDDATDAANAQSTISYFTYVEPHVLDAVVAYAGNLASHGIDSGDDAKANNGILTIGNDGTLTVDFTQDKWTFGNDQIDPAYKQDVISDFFSGDSTQGWVTYAADWYAHEHNLALTGLDRLSYISFGADNAPTQTPPTLDDSNLDLMVSESSSSSGTIDDNDRSILLVTDSSVTSVMGHSGTDMVLVASFGDTSYSTGAGDDLILANGGNNDITPGAGNDTVVLNGGSTVYHFSSGDGQDTIERINAPQLELDLSSFNSADATLTWDFTPDGTWYQSNPYWPVQVEGGGDLVISLGGSDSILIKNVTGDIYVSANDDGSPNTDYTQGFAFATDLYIKLADRDNPYWIDNGVYSWDGIGSPLGTGSVSPYDHGLGTGGYFGV